MESEIQKRRTYEILAKWIAKQNQIHIELLPDITPSADPVNKVIRMPDNVKADNIYPALAWLMHEAAHIRHTVFDTKNLVDDGVDFTILNAVEDVRIDRKNFARLPNIQGFYEEMVKFVATAKKLSGNVPIEAKVLCDCIMMAEGFSGYTTGDQDVRKFIIDTRLLDEIERLIYTLNSLEPAMRGQDKKQQGQLEKETKKQVEVIREILFNIKKQRQKQGQARGQGSNQDPQPSGQNQAEPSAGDSNPAGSDGLDLSDAAAALGGGVSQAIFGELEKSPKNSTALGTAALKERTKQTFQELLNIKEKHVVDDGVKLNTDNLTSYFIGDIEGLFMDDTIVKRKKSKIMLVLDCSGSMSEPLLDNTRRNQTLAETAISIVDILKEAQAIEGINVDWDIRAFDGDYHTLKKDSNWSKQYMTMNGGSTNILKAFDSAQTEMLKDQTIEGKRMIVLITDGEVHDGEINDIRRSIIRHNQDVRAMVIGVGAKPNGHFVKTVTGHNILCKEIADAVLMEAICDMLED